MLIIKMRKDMNQIFKKAKAQNILRFMPDICERTLFYKSLLTVSESR